MTDIFFVIMTAANLSALILAGIIAVEYKTQGISKTIRIGVAVGAIGSLAQAARNIEFMLTGVSPADSDLPLWALKDLGLTFIIFGLYLVASGRVHSRISDNPEGKRHEKS